MCAYSFPPSVLEPEEDSKFYYQFHVDAGWLEKEYVKFPGDIYIVMMDVFGNEDYAMDMLAWCENAKPGDVYDDDDDVRIGAL